MTRTNRFWLTLNSQGVLCLFVPQFLRKGLFDSHTLVVHWQFVTGTRSPKTQLFRRGQSVTQGEKGGGAKWSATVILDPFSESVCTIPIGFVVVDHDVFCVVVWWSNNSGRGFFVFSNLHSSCFWSVKNFPETTLSKSDSVLPPKFSSYLGILHTIFEETERTSCLRNFTWYDTRGETLLESFQTEKAIHSHPLMGPSFLQRVGLVEEETCTFMWGIAQKRNSESD